MNIIKKYFSQAARDRRELQSDNKRLAELYRIAEQIINVRFMHDGIWVTFDNTPLLRVTNNGDVNARTIANSQVELFVKDLRDDWVNSHKNDERR